MGYARKMQGKRSVALPSALTSLELEVLSNFPDTFMNCRKLTFLSDMLLGRNILPQQEEAVPCISVLFSDDPVYCK